MRRGWLPAFHHAAALGSFAVVTLAGVSRLAAGWAGHPSAANPWLAWAAVLSVVALLVGCLWDRAAKYAPGCLYFLGLLAAVRVLDPARLGPAGLARAMGLVLAAYAACGRRDGGWASGSARPACRRSR